MIYYNRGYNPENHIVFSCELVGLGRVELPTRSLGNCCSIHLSYSPIVGMIISGENPPFTCSMLLVNEAERLLRFYYDWVFADFDSVMDTCLNPFDVKELRTGK
jgi:hypothetical protein